ncbi:hypothetical protein YDYSG_25830 [Paenibacillus tyrfis]|uniref:hypothetical protein n=1 Tax=Paenibacillus tyrfis TaxID=1501230 RepID=UPI002491C488|nr:hypothetical protein [Paenibacillus tyrfis]GLI06553.1 hypothetical protein YDYSG_25830 [Paenibacillus tyrfis]
MERSPTAGSHKRYLAYFGTLNINLLHLRKPWVIAWWSAAFPGFGHLLLGSHIKGLILILWEIGINMQSGINKSMVYSFTGHVDLSKQVLNPRWLLLYIPVYIYAIWDSYRSTIELNKQWVLAEWERAPIVSFKMSGMSLNHLDKSSPWLAMAWSMLMPGLGQLYLRRIPIGFFLLAGWIGFMYFSAIAEIVLVTMAGGNVQAWHLINTQWALFMPSFYCFAAYEAYVYSVGYNKLFDKAQNQWLERNYGTLRLRFGRATGR